MSVLLITEHTSHFVNKKINVPTCETRFKIGFEKTTVFAIVASFLATTYVLQGVRFRCARSLAEVMGSKILAIIYFYVKYRNH